MEYVKTDERRAITTITALFCVTLLLGTIGAPALQGAYYLDNEQLPSVNEIADYWWNTFLGDIVGAFDDIWGLSVTIHGILEDFSTGDIVQGSTALITAIFDLIWDFARMFGLGWSWELTVLWETTKFVAWV